jgi:hypothetical protein
MFIGAVYESFRFLFVCAHDQTLNSLLARCPGSHGRTRFSIVQR